MAQLRSDKRKRETGEDEDIFEAHMKEEEDVYDVYNEEEYATLVNSRRQREDFVVDDGEKQLATNDVYCILRGDSHHFFHSRRFGLL